GLYFEENRGPKFKKPIRSEQAINNLEIPSQESLSYVYQAVSQCRHEINGQVPLIGFSGSPWTLACYMVEGQSSKDFITIKSMLYSNPK
ncbi:uroporphyrinogen decarboxylase family protein, partial [Acinetobacter baumannii]